MSNIQSEAVDFVRVLSRLDATALVVGSMIGSGIFIVSADIVRQVEAPGLLLVVWGLAGVVTLLGALTYGELAALFPHAGGQYVYLREGISPLFGYLYGWTLFAVIQTGTIAAVAVAFAKFASIFVPALTPDVFVGFTLDLPSGPIEMGLSPQRLAAIVLIAILTWVNVRGVHTAALVQNTFTLVKVAALAALIVLGLSIGRGVAAHANFGAAFWPAAGVGVEALPLLGAAMVGALFAMDAWNNVGFAADELRNPNRDLPFAMASGVVLVVALYLLANVAYLQVLPAAEIATAPQDRVGTQVLLAILGEPGLWVMAGAIMISAVGCSNGMILTGARLYYAMAQDRLFFARAGQLHPRHRTPVFGLVLQALWASVLCVSGSYGQLLDYVVFAAMLFYLLTAIGLFALRWRRPDAARPVRVPLYPWLPALYVVATGLICVDLLIEKPRYTWTGLFIVALGVPVYYVWKHLAARAPAPAGH